jgi:protein tyrosine phosphatase
MKKIMLFLLMLPISGFAATSSSNYIACRSPWEEVKASDFVHMCRLSVPHGWLILTLNHGFESSSTTTFITDESHEWVLNAN